MFNPIRTAADAKAVIEKKQDMHHAYHEVDLGSVPKIEVDVLEQLKGNLQILEDLHGRLKFVMTEVQGLLRK